LQVDHSIATTPSVVFDDVFIRGCAPRIAILRVSGDATHFVMDACKLCKAIAAMEEGSAMLDAVCALAQGGASGALDARRNGSHSRLKRICRPVRHRTDSPCRATQTASIVSVHDRRHDA